MREFDEPRADGPRAEPDPCEEPDIKDLDVPLEPGDVLLAGGSSEHSKAIRRATGGHYSHAAIWTGDSVIEATLPRVREVSRGQFSKAQTIIVAYRHRHGDAAQRAKIAERAREQLGVEYCRADLVITIALQTMALWVHNRWLGDNTLYRAGQAIQIFDHWSQYYLETYEDKLTCAELAVKAHWTAGLPIRVKIKLEGRVDPRELLKGIGSLLEVNRRVSPGQAKIQESLGAADDFRALEEDIGWFADAQAWLERERELPPGIREEDYDASVEDIENTWLIPGQNWSAGLVTAKQLEYSPDLKLLGRVRWPDEAEASDGKFGKS